MTPEERALLIHLTFPTRNTDGEADAMEKFTAEQIRAAIAEEREAGADEYPVGSWPARSCGSQ